MSDTSSLTELARFIGQSSLGSPDPQVRRRAINAMSANLNPKPATRRVADLLGAVLALSARTRRMVLPKVEIEIDVFAPGGKRALLVTLPQRG